MRQKKNFIGQFLKNKKMIGSMVPSSRFLAKKMLKNINFKEANVIIELGPGTGVFTDRLLELMHPESILLIFELNDTFFNQLANRIDDPRVHLIHDSAERLGEYLTNLGLSKADAVISSLPLANFHKLLRDKILEVSKQSLSTGGKFIQFQYTLQSKKVISSKFEGVKIAFTPLNFPPAFVYTCYK